MLDIMMHTGAGVTWLDKGYIPIDIARQPVSLPAATGLEDRTTLQIGDWTLGPGLTVFVGPQGSGKTTLIRHIMSTLPGTAANSAFYAINEPDINPEANNLQIASTMWPALFNTAGITAQLDDNPTQGLILIDSIRSFLFQPPSYFVSDQGALDLSMTDALTSATIQHGSSAAGEGGTYPSRFNELTLLSALFKLTNMVVIAVANPQYERLFNILVTTIASSVDNVISFRGFEMEILREREGSIEYTTRTQSLYRDDGKITQQSWFRPPDPLADNLV
jgi:energy-coupling factor transporter ATP-binding protein EcfA2